MVLRPVAAMRETPPTSNPPSEGADVAAFSSEAEVYEFLGGVFRRGMDDADLVAKLEPTGIVLRITYTDPDAVITVDMPGKEIHEGAGLGPEPNVELFMTADTGNRFWLGKVILPVALAKGQVRAKGPVAKLLKVLPLAKQMFGPYREHLESAGRSDLLGA
ncbi:sterol carrier protein [Pseudonocardia abyssalis]|uniref:sterol carrier protein n=1 Tax=Pseudonocardia abyssalis TaxID=2792008 RepID=UPI001CF65C0B|nr:sterol carrier protein [Pseudonocardia abyssalis]